MPDLTLGVYLVRLSRDKCAECRKRRVLYRLKVCGGESEAIRSVARCAKCLGIGK